MGSVTGMEFYGKTVWSNILTSLSFLLCPPRQTPLSSRQRILSPSVDLSLCVPLDVSWLILVCFCGFFFAGFFSLSLSINEFICVVVISNTFDLIAEYFSYIIHIYKNIHILPSKHYLIFMTVSVSRVRGLAFGTILYSLQ